MQDTKKSIGIYIHIPFCQVKCAYCDFLSGPASEGNKKKYVDALVQQIKEAYYLKEEYYIRTIFIGGGTPSSIDPVDIRRILETVYEVFDLDNTYNNENNQKMLQDNNNKNSNSNSDIEIT